MTKHQKCMKTMSYDFYPFYWNIHENALYFVFHPPNTELKNNTLHLEAQGTPFKIVESEYHIDTNHL